MRMGGDRENGHEAEKVNGSRGGEQLKVDSTRTPNQGKDGRVLKVDATRLSESGAALDSSHLVGYSPLRLAFAPDVDVKEVDCLLLLLPPLPSPFLGSF